ncbi:helix-turn-helix transcriptional regulator [Streptomyces sp. UNOB3_S3]|uniref:helix-turn-helix domain-containing protein n=1 Tax=Streptomyces sp. UNOB3_S3 TaxID=2871682 RepID=UPI001E587500|nr:helix-turn-helix transcriptional regulator [Streptomyces sp. UNOB3_S3]MCC3773853.1 helix-turn-helix domain-containing protein [Streptomyces sp. UNOB3_S3]
MSAVRKAAEPSPARVIPLERGTKREAAARLLGAQLRILRQEQGLGLKDAAPVIRGSVSKVSRLERGESPPKERDVMDLALFYGATTEQIQEIEALLRQAQHNEWWQQYSDVMPGFLKRLIALEDSADEIHTYENHVVPGLLQTADYARVLVTAAMPDASEESIRKRVELRKRRQLMLNNDLPRVVALLDEGVLRRPVGGPRVMYEQLKYLLHAGEVQNVNIRIVEFEYSADVAPTYPITHLRFGDGGPAELVYVEHIDNAMYRTRPEEVDRYRHVLNELGYAAATREKSNRLLAEAAERYRRRIRD